jgi:hypothetical protein
MNQFHVVFLGEVLFSRHGVLFGNQCDQIGTQSSIHLVLGLSGSSLLDTFPYGYWDLQGHPFLCILLLGVFCGISFFIIPEFLNKFSAVLRLLGI